jgi:hypothetical protein
MWLNNSKKIGVHKHQRFLPTSHPYHKMKWKNLLNPLNYQSVSNLHPNYKIICFTPWTFQNRSNYTPKRFWTAGCYSNHCFATVTIILAFSFLFIFAESLKNHSKSQKNHKIENLILLDSTWVDLHNEYII